MNYTENYQLPQWVETDRIMMDDFNEAMARVDQDCGNCRIATGSYVGTGVGGSSYPNSLTLDAIPALIIIIGGGFHVIFVRDSEKAEAYRDGSAYQYKVTWNDDGITWYNTGSSSATSQMNDTGTIYYYIALSI